MATPPVDLDKVERVTARYRQLAAEGLSQRQIADALKMPRSTLRRYHSLAKAQGWLPSAAIDVGAVPDVDDIEDLLASRKRAFERRRAHEDASKLISVRVKIPGPIGILHFGDPHVDDDGTDIQALEDHTELARTTEALFAANLGDTTNNWVGRLARLYAEQSTTAKQAWMLAEWFVRRCQWLYMIGGNHDTWSGAGDPLKWIARQHADIHAASEARIALNFPNGAQVVVNARHDFAGNSQWNPAHGAMKAIQMGLRDHLTIHGHKHVSGYGIIKDAATGRVCHAVPVASYKIFDRYAKERGFRDQAISPCVLTVIDPAIPETSGDMVKVFFDPHEGADYLKFKRRQASR